MRQSDARPFSTQLAELLRTHHPSMTDEDEQVIIGLSGETWEFDAASLAIRHCACGALIDGFDEYIDHLQEAARATSPARSS